MRIFFLFTLFLFSPFLVFAAVATGTDTVDLFGLVLWVMKWFPATGPYIVSLGAILAGLTVAATAGIGLVRIIVKVTFWTNKDDELLAKVEATWLKLSTGPFRPIFLLIDRLSLLGDGVQPFKKGK